MGEKVKPRVKEFKVSPFRLNRTVVEIIEEINRLPKADQNRVIEFVRKAGEKRPLAPGELGKLAKHMVEAKDPAEADRLQEEIMRGFYGGQSHA